MSVSELTAQAIYDRYNFGALSDEIKRQLMILFLTKPEKKGSIENHVPAISEELLRNRVITATSEIEAGKGKPLDELLDETSAKYPWLCE